MAVSQANTRLMENVNNVHDLAWVDDEMPGALRPREWDRVEQFITRVLSRARQAAAAADQPDDIRGILYVAHCFADALATENPRFDRVGFIRAAEGLS